MLDIGISKLMIVGGIALIVIGPERLPRVARMVGTLVGRAQRYVADVKAEVNRSIELEELQKMKSQFETAARDVEQTVRSGVDEAGSGVSQAWNDATGTPDGHLGEGLQGAIGDGSAGWTPAPPSYQHPGKKWRLKTSAVPRWYKQQQRLRTHTQSGAARVARFRPPGQRTGRNAKPT
ncbi:MAG: Sec-independent protein translocase protein TatB [Burkholderiaceae bacterium]